MKVNRSEIESGPIRWFMRVTGWYCLIAGILMLVGKVAAPALYDSLRVTFPAGPVMPLGIGGLLVVLDLILPDPKRAWRKKKKQYEKLYAAVCMALPSNQAVFSAAVNSGNSSLLERQIRMNTSFAKDIFRKVPVREMLVFIHTCNRQAAYTICEDIAQAAKQAGSK